jgi:predicted dehydrogenase
MNGRKRCLMIGAGGMAAAWVRSILPTFAARLEIVGLVDVSPDALAASGEFLQLPETRRFGDMRAAFDAVDADFAVVVVPAAFHADAIEIAAARGVAVLCEKPLAADWAGCVRAYRAATEAKLKVQVVQNYRYRAPMLAMRDVLRSGDLGRLNYLVARWADDCREYDSWQRRHELPHAVLMDAAAHHFDMLRNLSGADCARITAMEWNPPWSSSRGEFCALCVLRMTDGSHATYEGNATAAGEQNTWRQDGYRGECEAGAVSVGLDQVVRIYRHRRGRGLVIEEVPAPPQLHEGHEWIVHEFLEWLDDGPPPATTIEDNLHTAAMVFGAIESASSGQAVDVARLVRSAKDEPLLVDAGDHDTLHEHPLREHEDRDR